jgi:hypothetical protein
MDWSPEEVEYIVADYLQMLTLELTGQSFNKAAHNRQLQQKLNGRSKASIEFKHQNISAVLLDLGYLPIQGYLPRRHYQASLSSVVIAQIRLHPVLDQASLAAVEKPALAPPIHDFSKVKSDAPTLEVKASEPPGPLSFVAVKRDYLAREAQNRSLGLAGEIFVAEFERWRLMQFGEKRLAERVEHVSQSQGDGLGYDILSFDASGRERLIEVKTTSFGKETPFFVTNGELVRSRQDHEQFHLYRLFDFRRKPRLFSLQGRLDQNCILDPHTYRASFS